jgi:hypothetical protein
MVEGKLEPSPSKFAVEKINTEDVVITLDFEVLADKVLYASCRRLKNHKNVVYDSEEQFNSI